MHEYAVRPRAYKRRVDLISDVLPFGALWYGESDAISFCLDIMNTLKLLVYGPGESSNP